VEFEWDEAKSRRTLQERGFDFDFATRIFRGRTFEREDTRLNYSERRVIAVGKVRMSSSPSSTPIAKAPAG
jgi:uncharacterized DUF497 family protein